MTLSKSQYIRALQCPKMLWMDMFKPDKAADTNLDNIFETGNEVGDLARQYFGNYSLVDFSFNKEQMIADTEKLIESGAKNIAEASFMFDGFFCSVDILHKNPYGWDIIEVKSSTHTTDVYINDMAFQYYVLRGAGLNITGVYNMHINSNYVRYGELELAKLFTIEDYTRTVLSRQGIVKFNIDGIRRYIWQWLMILSLKRILISVVTVLMNVCTKPIAVCIYQHRLFLIFMALAKRRSMSFITIILLNLVM